ncbi:MAG: glycosyltransferase, partial [Ramlibacter sp.]|nr:glycosyltransferase [Ramlibacter sp.]
MKVLHVIPSLSQAHGGATSALVSMEAALLAAGVGVETAATDDDGPGRRNGHVCGVPLQEGGAVRWYFPKRTEFYKASPAFMRWIADNVTRYDLVHIHALFSFTSLVAARAAKRAAVPYIIEPLGTLNDYGLTQRRPWLKQLSLRLLEAPLLRSAAAVRFTSQQEALEARRLGLSLKEAVIPLGVELPPLAPTSVAPLGANDTIGLLFLSRLDPKKNLEGLLDAMSLLRESAPQVHLVIAGDGPGPYVEQLKARCARLEIADIVHWAGHLESDAKEAAFADASIFVLPSFSENFGMAAAEALARGLPCVLGAGV